MKMTMVNSGLKGLKVNLCKTFSILDYSEILKLSAKRKTILQEYNMYVCVTNSEITHPHTLASSSGSPDYTRMRTRPPWLHTYNVDCHRGTRGDTYRTERESMSLPVDLQKHKKVKLKNYIWQTRQHSEPGSSFNKRWSLKYLHCYVIGLSVSLGPNPSDTRRWIDVGLTLVQHWFNVLCLLTNNVMSGPQEKGMTHCW